MAKGLASNYKGTYSGDPSKNDKDHIRFLLGDTDSRQFLLGDTEITGILSIEGNLFTAASTAAEAIAARFARLCDESVGNVKVSLNQKADAYLKLAKTLRRKSAIKNAVPFAGGLKITDKLNQELDTDRVDPSFTRDLHENERAPDRDTDVIKVVTVP